MRLIKHNWVPSLAFPTLYWPWSQFCQLVELTHEKSTAKAVNVKDEYSRDQEYWATLSQFQGPAAYRKNYVWEFKGVIYCWFHTQTQTQTHTIYSGNNIVSSIIIWFPLNICVCVCVSVCISNSQIASCHLSAKISPVAPNISTIKSKVSAKLF